MTTTVRSTVITSANANNYSMAGLGHATGDAVVVLVGSNGQGDIDDNNGATPLTEDVVDFHETNNGLTLSIFSRRVIGGDPSSWAFVDDLNNESTCFGIAFQNPDGTTIYDVAPTGTNTTTPNTNASSGNCASITTTTANAIHVCGVCMYTAGTTFTPPAGYTLQNSGGTNTCIAVATKVIAAAGATGAQSWSWSNSERHIFFSFAIKDSGGGSSPVLAAGQYDNRLSNFTHLRM